MQNHIALVIKNGEQIDFERWSYKKPETVKRKMLELYNGRFHDIYVMSGWEGAECRIMATPNGYDYPREAEPVLTFTFE